MALTAEPGIARRYLSRLHLNLRDRRVRTDLANSQALHRRLLEAFPGASSRADVQLLYRVEAPRGAHATDYVILVQSGAEPDWTCLDAGYLRDQEHAFGWSESNAVDMKDISGAFVQIGPGDQFRFRLRANPTQKRHFKAGESPRPTGKNGTRVPLFVDRELQEWIARKADQHGFRLLGVRWQPDPVTGDIQRGSKADGKTLTHYAVLFEGALRVTDATAFQDALASGIGPAKAYGFGLLSLAPVNVNI